MSCLVWNCRGLVQDLTRILRSQDPKIVFLIERWSNEKRLELLRCQLQLNSKLVVSSGGRGGGICLFWQDEVNLSIRSFSLSHIDAIVNSGNDNCWRFTGFYGAPDHSNREESWNLLRTLHHQYHLPWLCAGDFNEITKNIEKRGRLPLPERQMLLFREAIDECELLDLGYTGVPFTWCNNQDAMATVWARLDRAMASVDWVNKFQGA